MIEFDSEPDAANASTAIADSVQKRNGVYELNLDSMTLALAAFVIFAANFLIDGGIRLVAFTSFGFFAPDKVPLMLAAVPVAAFGSYLGGRIHLRMQQSDFVRLISALLLVSGLALVLRA